MAILLWGALAGTLDYIIDSLADLFRVLRDDGSVEFRNGLTSGGKK